MNIVDLRSDTVTQPTPQMRAAMANAEVGDDVFGEDPTINRLEALAAEKTGKEAGLFIPSGTMGNLLAVLTHCGRGDEVIMGTMAHTFLSEGGGIAALGGVHTYTIPNQRDGTLNFSDLESAIRIPNDPHHPLSRLVILENTQNRCGGSVLSPQYTRQFADLAHQKGLLLHLDGARVFNAAAALGVDVKELTGPVDTVTFCLSKGLCAPVGSVLCGPKDFTARARRIRKQLGAGMRQAGVLAAAGIVALETMTERLAEDHRRAKQLAEKITGVPWLKLEWEVPPSNMVFASLPEATPFDARQAAQWLDDQGVKVSVFGPRRLRMVLHYWIDDDAVAQAAAAFAKIELSQPA